MNADIANMINSCLACQELRQSQQEEPLLQTEASFPMQEVAMDLFDYEGQTWLAMVDKFSGYPFAHKLRSTTTAAVTTVINDWFLEFGYPHAIRSDNGPQFRSEFKSYCDSKAIQHLTASPYNPQSNGLAEAAVKNVKYLLKKCAITNEDFKTSLFAFRNMPRADGFSPAQLFFHRKPRTTLPCFKQEKNIFFPSTLHGEIRHQTRLQHKAVFDTHAKELPRLQVGQRVLIQHPQTKLWDSTGEILEVHLPGRSYSISTDAGKTIRRNRRFLKPTSLQPALDARPAEEDDTLQPRRSARLKSKSVSFNL